MLGDWLPRHGKTMLSACGESENRFHDAHSWKGGDFLGTGAPRGMENPILHKGRAEPSHPPQTVPCARRTGQRRAAQPAEPAASLGLALGCRVQSEGWAIRRERDCTGDGMIGEQ